MIVLADYTSEHKELYNQLIGLIKSADKNCTIYQSKSTPRGDTDVTEFNNAIQRLSDHWKIHHVKCIEDTSICSSVKMACHQLDIIPMMAFIFHALASIAW